MKYSTKYQVFPATFPVISRKVVYLWDSVAKCALSIAKNVQYIFCTTSFCKWGWGLANYVISRTGWGGGGYVTSSSLVILCFNYSRVNPFTPGKKSTRSDFCKHLKKIPHNKRFLRISKPIKCL